MQQRLLDRPYRSAVTRVRRLDETVGFHEQQRRVQRQVVVGLRETSDFLLPSVFHHVVADVVGLPPPAAAVLVFAEQVGDLRAPVQRHPAHHFRRDELAAPAADLPDSLVRFAPLLRHGRENVLDHLPHVLDFVERTRHQAVVLVDQIHQVSERVVLPLVVGIVADAHGFGVPVTRQMIQCSLGQCPLAADAVHDLVGLVRVDERRLDEAHEPGGRSGVSDAEERLDGHRSVSEPAEAVIPVADVAGAFGQTGREGRQHGAVVVGHEFQCQQAPFDHVVVISEPFRAVRPVEPVDQRAAVFEFFAFDVYRNHFFVVRQQEEFVAFEDDLLPPCDLSERQRGVEIEPVLRVGEAVVFDEFGCDGLLRAAAGIVGRRGVMYPQARPSPDPPDVAVEFGRHVVFVPARTVAGHEIEYDELALGGREGRGEDVRVGDVGLRNAVFLRDVESEASPFPTVEQRCEHRWRVEVGQAHPFDGSACGDERRRAAVADDAVIQIIVHIPRYGGRPPVFSDCSMSCGSRVSRRPGRNCRGPGRGVPAEERPRSVRAYCSGHAPKRCRP